MNQHSKKIIAPVVAVLILGVYYAAIGITIVKLAVLMWVKILIIVIPLLICVLLIAVLVQRIKEIRSGEEDDLGKY